MPNRSERFCRTSRCAVCDGRFGLIRHYSWRTPLCSRKCVDCFRARRESDRNLLPLGSCWKAINWGLRHFVCLPKAASNPNARTNHQNSEDLGCLIQDGR